MKKTITMAFAAALAAAAAVAGQVAAEFDVDEKALLRNMAEQVKAKMKSAIQIGDKAVTLLPVRGDRDAYMEQQLVGAMTGAGLAAVISNDNDNDERFRRILKEIRWDAVQARLGSVDPATIDELGRLMSTQVFMEARLSIASKESKSGKRKTLSAELNLLAYAVSTKRYVWSATVVASSEEGGKPILVTLLGTAPEIVPLEAKVEFKPADKSAGPVADRLDTLARGTLAKLGYMLDTGRTPDVVLSAEVSKSEFDKSGGYFRFEGTAKVKASVMGAKPHLLDEESISDKGLRGLGVSAANNNLADGLFEQLSPWMKRTIKADAIGFEAISFAVRFPGPVEGVADIMPIADFSKAIESMDGVRTCTLVGQDKTVNSATFRVAYEKAKFPIGFLNALFTEHPELEKLLGE